MLVSEEDQALVCFCFFLIFIRLNHLDPPVNGQAVIFLTGLLEVFIIYSNHLTWYKSCKSAQLDRALPQPPLLQQELTFYPSGQIEQSSRLFTQRSILSRVKTGRGVDCGLSLVWADLELSPLVQRLWRSSQQSQLWDESCLWKAKSIRPIQRATPLIWVWWWGANMVKLHYHRQIFDDKESWKKTLIGPGLEKARICLFNERGDNLQVKISFRLSLYFF